MNFDDREKDLEKHDIYDTRTEIFYDDIDELGVEKGVQVHEYEDMGKISYSISVPNCNIWMSEEMFKRVGLGVEKAMLKIRKRVASQTKGDSN